MLPAEQTTDSSSCLRKTVDGNCVAVRKTITKPSREEEIRGYRGMGATCSVAIVRMTSTALHCKSTIVNVISANIWQSEMLKPLFKLKIEHQNQQHHQATDKQQRELHSGLYTTYRGNFPK